MAGKPIHFDPDLVDVRTEPGYDAMAGSLGPILRPKSIVRWAPDGSPSLAKRAEMLEIDREMFAEWDAAMQKLLVKDLSDAEFTTERMFRLRLWTKERKRRQHNLHYKYDPTRRNPRLVQRDSKKQIEAMRRKVEEARARLEAKRADMVLESPEPKPAAARPVTRSRPLPRRTNPVNPDPFIPDYLDAVVVSMIANDTGIPDPARAEDSELTAAYEAMGRGGYVADYYLALLRGRPLPERPEELG